MALFQWDDSFSVKVSAIDYQHEKLVNMVNDFHDAIVENRSQEAMGPLLDGLANYTVEHFATEERYFKQFNYPDAANHIKEHEALTEKVTDMIKRYKENRLLLTLEVAQFLKNWLKNHILGTDMKYSEFFVSKGLR